MTTRHPDFPEIQRRLRALSLYPNPLLIDDEWGPGMSSGIFQLLAVAEKAAGIIPAPPRPSADTVGMFARIPAAYHWLADSVLPRHLSAALALYGTVETPGAGNNPTILSWRDQLKAGGCEIVGYSGDAVPWCGLFVAYCIMMAGRVDSIPEGPLWALNWSKYGVDGGQPELGDILTFKREGGGHVGFYIAEDREGFYHVLGGNQSDRVNIMRIAKKRMHACRQPAYTNKPGSVRPVIVSAAGAPVSTNER